MKNLFFILVCFLGVNSVLAQETTVAEEKVQEVNWVDTYKEALQKGKDENKPVLVYFTGSDWCPPCKQLDAELFHSEKFKVFSDKNLILYKADFPRNRDLVSVENRKINTKLQYELGVGSFPTVVVLNAKGQEIARKKGAYMSDYYYPFLESILKNY